MRTSLNEIKLIEGHLFNSHSTEDRLLFDAMLILNPDLPEQVLWQKKAHKVINQYSRKKLKVEIAALQQQLFSSEQHRTFRQKILSLFYKK